MSEDLDISQEETGFPLLKEGNFASFAPVNKRWFSRDSHAHALLPERQSLMNAHTTVSRSYTKLFILF